MYFIYGLVIGLVILNVWYRGMARIQQWRWERAERPLGIHFQWSDISDKKDNQ